MDGTGSVASAVSASLLLRQEETAVGTTVSLLKKATDADKNLVATLLPSPATNPGGVDIRA